eukprot:317444-Pyramimonas_sp.AAC.1
MEGDWFSKCGSCLSAAHIKSSQQLQGWMAVLLKHVALASAPRTFFFGSYGWNPGNGGLARFNSFRKQPSH